MVERIGSTGYIVIGLRHLELAILAEVKIGNYLGISISSLHFDLIG